jgi:(Z)-2-((N-methylformamido)methylene)-5-hydroxybutyrolactone dehydrogenase
MNRFDNYIGGQTRPPAGGRYFDTDNPFTGKVWAKVARSDATDVDIAVAVAKVAFENGAWSSLSAVQRAALLRRLGDLVKDNVEPLARAEVVDNGKTITEMRTQVRNIAEWYYYYAGLADKFGGEVLRTERTGFFNYSLYEPLGVIAMITPWNSPLRLLAWKLAPALAAGNTAVIKPSEFASTSTLAFVKLVKEAGFPDGVVNVVTGFGAEVGSALVNHRDVAKVAFTGGTGAGTAIYQAAAAQLRPVVLELGGKSPNIVFADADLDRAAKGAVAAIFASNGQSCVAGSRLLVQTDVHDRIVKDIVRLVANVVMGDPLDPQTELGPMANRPQLEKVLRYVEIAKADGAKLVCGGKPLDIPGCPNALFMAPTVFTGCRNEMRIAQEEVFGPILAVIKFKDEAEAIRLANASPYGLAAGIWTRDINRAHRVAAKVQAGSVWVNTYRVTSQLSPFGGFKNSGLGREGGAEMLKSYMQTKSVWLDLNEDFQTPFKGRSTVEA